MAEAPHRYEPLPDRDHDIDEITESLPTTVEEGLSSIVELLALITIELRDLKWMFDSFERHFRVRNS